MDFHRRKMHEIAKGRSTFYFNRSKSSFVTIHHKPPEHKKIEDENAKLFDRLDAIRKKKVKNQQHGHKKSLVLMQQKGELEKAERENSRLTDALKNTKASISKQKQSQWYENNRKFCENISKYKKNKYIDWSKW